MENTQSTLEWVGGYVGDNKDIALIFLGNKDLQKNVAAIMRSNDFNVLIARTIEEAAEIREALSESGKHVDILLFPVIMDGQQADAHAVVNLITEHNPEVKIIIAIAIADIGDKKGTIGNVPATILGIPLSTREGRMRLISMLTQMQQRMEMQV